MFSDLYDRKAVNFKAKNCDNSTIYALGQLMEYHTPRMQVNHEHCDYPRHTA